MTNAQQRLIDSIVNHGAYANRMISYIKENFGVDGIYDYDNCAIVLECKSPDNALRVAAAKEYIEGTMGEDMIRAII